MAEDEELQGEEDQDPVEKNEEDKKPDEKIYSISWLKVTFSEGSEPQVQIMKIWWKTEEVRDRIVSDLKASFLEKDPGTTFIDLDEDEGRKVAGWIVMSTHPPWEAFVSMGMQPVVMMTGSEN